MGAASFLVFLTLGVLFLSLVAGLQTQQAIGRQTDDVVGENALAREAARKPATRAAEARAAVRIEMADGDCDRFGARGNVLEGGFKSIHPCGAARRSQLPTVDNNKKFTVWVAQGTIGAIRKSGALLGKIIHGEKPGLNHAEFQFEEVTEAVGSVVAFNIGYFFVGDSLNLLEGGFAKVTWFPNMCADDRNWANMFYKKSFGTITGKQLNQWLDWATEYNNKNYSYNPWTVSNQETVNKWYDVYLDSSNCYTFVRWGLIKLNEISPRTEKPLMCSPLMSILSDGAENLHYKGGVSGWQAGMEELWNNWWNWWDGGWGRALWNMGKLIFKRADGTNFRIAVKPPWIDWDGKRSFQRMLLPWQSKDDAVWGECNQDAQRIMDNTESYWSGDTCGYPHTSMCWNVCPVACQTCKDGNSGDGVPLVNGICTEFCSKYGYCGTKNAYEVLNGGTDCSPCSKACPAVCRKCMSGAKAANGMELINGTCTAFCSKHGYCGTSREHRVCGTDCSACQDQ